MSEKIDDNEQQFVETWKDDSNGCREIYRQLKKLLQELSGVSLEFNPRPGITYSLRAKHEKQTERELFVMVDVIDDDPEDRWLSVCFFGDMISDPEEKGDFVPEGLLGHDAHCFDLDNDDPAERGYVKERASEAFDAASGA